MIVGDVAVWTIRGYQKMISAHLPPTCRFYPSCSAYAVTAIRVHGPARGGYLATARILRCHPFNPGGLDPVPPPAGAMVGSNHQLDFPTGGEGASAPSSDSSGGGTGG